MRGLGREDATLTPANISGTGSLLLSIPYRSNEQGSWLRWLREVYCSTLHTTKLTPDERDYVFGRVVTGELGLANPRTPAW
eukprot:562489-Pyramimonas_sp.AAC.2